MSWFTKMLEHMGLRHPEAQQQQAAAPAVVAVPAIPVAMPAPFLPTPAVQPIVPAVAAPVAEPPTPAVVVAPIAPPEFSTHADGSVWWRDPVRGVEMGPSATLDEAIKLRDRVAAHDWAQDPRNPESQQATVDVPGVGYPVMAKEQADRVLAHFDASMAAGREDLAYYQLSSQEHFALQNRGMTRLAINTKINQYNR